MHELLLKNISRFIQLTAEETSFLISILKEKKIRKRQYLLQEGDICRYEYFVTKGCLRAYRIDNKGQEHIVQFAVEDWWIGDMYSFITATPATLTIDAIEDSQVLCIEKNALETLYTQVPKLERFYRILIQNAFIAQQERIIAGMSLDASGRYCSFVTKYPQLEKRLPLKQIASYLGIKPESLSRIRTQYTKSKKA